MYVLPGVDEGMLQVLLILGRIEIFPALLVVQLMSVRAAIKHR